MAFFTRILLGCVLMFQLVPAAAQNIYSTGDGNISFSSDAPLELIKASSNGLRGKVDIAKKLFAFTIKTSSFQGFNSPLQKEHFNENYIESRKYPDASFSGKIIEDVDLSSDGERTIRAKGNLNIHGVTKERIIKIQVRISKGIMYINSAFTVLLSDHDISIPRVVNEKLASEIKVVVQATLSP